MHGTLAEIKVIDYWAAIAGPLTSRSVPEHPMAVRTWQRRPAQQFSRRRAEAGTIAPLLGEHTDELLREAGYNAEAISVMRASGAVG